MSVLCTARLFGLITVTLGVASLPGPAIAGVIRGTGLAGPGNPDAYWNVVAVPGVWTPPASVPYSAYTLNTGAVGWGADTPNPSQPWDEPQGGYINADGHFYWVNIQSTDASVVPFGEGPSTWVVAQSFTIDEAGYYDFTFPAMSDELLDIYINGSVSTANKTPTIVGGAHVSIGGAGAGTNNVNFRASTSVTTAATYLNQGTNTFYAKVTDNGFSTGLLLGDIHFATAVPEPSTYAMALAGLAYGGFSMWRRRKRA